MPSGSYSVLGGFEKSPPIRLLLVASQRQCNGFRILFDYLRKSSPMLRRKCPKGSPQGVWGAGPPPLKCIYPRDFYRGGEPRGTSRYRRRIRVRAVPLDTAGVLGPIPFTFRWFIRLDFSQIDHL